MVAALLTYLKGQHDRTKFSFRWVVIAEDRRETQGHTKAHVQAAIWGDTSSQMMPIRCQRGSKQRM